MKQLCGTNDCALDESPWSTASEMTTSPDGVEQTSLTTYPTSDPLNVMGTVGGIVISLMIAIGVVGNLLVLTAIVRCPQLRRSYNAFIASLSVTDLIFNVTVMPFYVETYVHRDWRLPYEVCLWHTFFSTIVVVSSSLHIALIAISRYHVIVHPRFYARWLSSGAAVASQIVFAWVAATALVLPGVLEVLPTNIRYSDQLSRCNYDRAASYGALSVVFCVGFIVPCVVMGYCYGMIWHHTRKIRRRVDGYSACQLLPMRQHNDDYKPFFPPCTAVPSNPNVNAQEMARTEPLLTASNNRQIASTDDKIVDVYRSASQPQSSDKYGRVDCVMECTPETTVGCRDRLLPAVDVVTISVPVDYPRVGAWDDVAAKDASTAIQSSPGTTARPNTASCLSSGSDEKLYVDDNEQDNVLESGRLINSSGYYQLETSPFPAFGTGKTESSSSEPSMNRNNDGPAADKADQLEHLPVETRTPTHESIIITPATSFSSADVAGKNHGTEEHLQRLTSSDSARLSVENKQLPTTRRSFRMLPFSRRLAGRKVDEHSPASSSTTCHRSRSHSLYMILAVFFAFVLTYLPYTVTNLADQRARLDRNVYMMTSLAFWAGSCVNPLIYGIMNVQFRHAYISIVVNCWRHLVARCRTP